MSVVSLVPQIESALSGIPHAFGGAIALAYCTQQPRGTVDIDLNVYIPVASAGEALDRLAPVVQATESQRARLLADEQVRLNAGRTPIDLFFSYTKFHDVASRRTRMVPFEGIEIPVLDCTDLAVFKAMFNRTKDWADIIEAVRAGSIDLRRMKSWMTRLVGADDPRHERLRAALDEAKSGPV